MPTPKELMVKAGVATRIAAVVLGPNAAAKQMEDFAIDLMHVPEARLRTILVALPGAEGLDERCLPDRLTIWERLMDPSEYQKAIGANKKKDF